MLCSDRCSQQPRREGKKDPSPQEVEKKAKEEEIRKATTDVASCLDLLQKKTLATFCGGCALEAKT